MTAMGEQLKKLAYVRKGSGSTRNMFSVVVKDMKDENVEAVDLLVRSMFSEVVRSSRGTYYVAL